MSAYDDYAKRQSALRIKRTRKPISPAKPTGVVGTEKTFSKALSPNKPKGFIDLLDVLEKNPDVYAVNPVNTVGVMGAGLAKQFKNKYPSHYNSYRKAYSQGRLKTGQVMLDSKNRIITFPTKQHWRDPSTEEYITSGAQSLRKLIETGLPENAKVVMPKLGSGLGGLNFNSQVAPILKQELGSVGDRAAVIDGPLIKLISKL